MSVAQTQKQTLKLKKSSKASSKKVAVQEEDVAEAPPSPVEEVVEVEDVFDVAKWEKENAPLVALKEQYPQVYEMALDKAKQEHANVLIEADKVEWMEKSGYSSKVEQRKILDEEIQALEQTEDGIKYLGSKSSRKVVKDRATGKSKGAEQLKAEKKARALKRKAAKAKGEGVPCGVGSCGKMFMKKNCHWEKCQEGCKADAEGK